MKSNSPRAPHPYLKGICPNMSGGCLVRQLPSTELPSTEHHNLSSIISAKGRPASGWHHSNMRQSLIIFASFLLYGLSVAQGNIDKRLEELGIVLQPPSAPVANYVHAVTSGNLVFLAGKGPTRPDGSLVTGKVGRDLTIEEGYEAARLTAIAQLAALKAHIGDLDRVVRVVKVLGLVNCNSEFTNQPEVINGFSDLMVAVFGEQGKHARSAVGANALPRNIAVEIELIVEIR